MANADDEAVWRRPSPDDPALADTAESATDQPTGMGLAPEKPVYTGPPPTVRPPQYPIPAPLIQPLPPPRELPPQDHVALDAEERQAQLVSYGVGIVAGVLALLLLLFIVVRGVTS